MSLVVERKKRVKLYFCLATIVVLMLCLLNFLISRESFLFKIDSTEPCFVVGSLLVEEDSKVIQPLSEVSRYSELSIRMSTSNPASKKGRICFSIFIDEEEYKYAELPVPVLNQGQMNTVILKEIRPIVTGENLGLLEIYTKDFADGNNLILYFGNSGGTGRFNSKFVIDKAQYYSIDGNLGLGKICYSLTGRTKSNAYIYYWVIVFAIVISFLFYFFFIGWPNYLKGKHNAIYVICILLGKYSFLLQQLVNRDFKKKYKRSYLGVLWSFLNPLLTMLVQYVVFSTLFSSDTSNYSVYLLIGIVFFNFFSETVTTGISSIVDNSNLINKVYLPKYIYPISVIDSCIVNFVLMLIPLFGFMVITKTKFTLYLFLLVFDLFCLFGFILGMVLILSALFVFFRDIQFLWRVISMLWMYATPIFYNPSIIPARLLPYYKMNPMYQYITFARTVIISAQSPSPYSFLWCFLCTVVVLFFGILIFSKNKEKFILYL